MVERENPSAESSLPIKQLIKQELLKKFPAYSSLFTDEILEKIAQQANKQELIKDVQVGRDFTISGDVIQEIFQIIVLPSPSIPIGICQNLPYSGTAQFIGRIDKLKELNQKLHQTERVAITAIAGMGGVGKTELALQYALQYQDNYPGSLCWFRVRDQDLGSQVMEFAATYLNLYPPDELKSDLAKVQYCWSRWTNNSSLIVLDDVPSYGNYYREKIAPYLPPNDSRFKVLMTCRQHPGTSIEELNLDVLSPEAALALMEALIGKTRIEAELEVAKALCEWLGCLPLGLELVGRYLEIDPSLTLETVLENLEEQKLEAEELLASEEADMTAQLGVAAAFELSWKELNPKAQRLGCYLSLFTPEPFDWSWVEEALIDDSSDETSTGLRKRDLLKQKRDLLKRNLLRMILNAQSPREYQYQLHSLIQQYFRAKLETLEQAELLKQKFSQPIIAIAQSIPQTPTQEDITRVALAIPHLRNVAIELIDFVRDDDLFVVFNGLGRFYEGQGIYNQAEQYFEQNLQTCLIRLGKEHPYIAPSLHNLAGLYRSQGRYSEAETLYCYALAMRLKLLGPEHPYIATNLNDLALLYSSQGRYSEAEPLFQQALEMTRKLLGPEHPDVACSLNNLAELYSSQGRYEEAEPLFQQALKIAEAALGENHPHTNTIRENFRENFQNAVVMKLLQLPEEELKQLVSAEFF